MFNVTGLSRVSQWDRPHGTFHVIVDLRQVSNSGSAMKSTFLGYT